MRWAEPVNGIAEITDMPDQVLDTFSSRTGRVQQLLDAKLERFLDTFDRDPTPRERWKLEREAVLDSRPAKRAATAAHDQHAEWTDQLAAALGLTPDALTHAVIGHSVPTMSHDTDTVVATALANITEQQSAWRPAELTRELAAAKRLEANCSALEEGARTATDAGPTCDATACEARSKVAGSSELLPLQLRYVNGDAVSNRTALDVGDPVRHCVNEAPVEVFDRTFKVGKRPWHESVGRGIRGDVARWREPLGPNVGSVAPPSEGLKHDVPRVEEVIVVPRSRGVDVRAVRFIERSKVASCDKRQEVLWDGLDECRKAVD